VVERITELGSYVLDQVLVAQHLASITAARYRSFLFSRDIFYTLLKSERS